MNTLELAVSGGLMRLHALERALHDDGPWAMDYAGMRVPAVRTVSDDHVLFSAQFPASAGSAPAFLLCDGEPLPLSLRMDPPDDGQRGPFVADWVLRIHAPAEV